MLPLLGYFLAAVMVISGLIPYGESQMLVFISTILLLSVYYRQYGSRLQRRTLVLLLLSFSLGNISAWAQWAGIPMSGHIQLLILTAVLLSLAWVLRLGFLNTLMLIFPIIGLTQQWGYGYFGGDPSAGVQLLVWSLATWPCITLMSQGRLWMMSSLFGVGALYSVSVYICDLGEIPRYMVVETLSEFYKYSSIELIIVQSLLVLVSVAPLLLHSASRWQWTTVCSAVLLAGPLIIVSMCGPWYDGWPPILWVVFYPALLGVGVGVVGMLCTVRRPELLYETSVRALALGTGASAVLLLALIYKPPGREDVIFVMAPALAPVLWAMVLAIGIMGSGFIARTMARSTDTLIIGTESWENSKSRIAVSVKLRMSDLTKDIFRDMKKDGSGWFNPSSFVPFFIFLSTWPVFHLFSGAAWVCFGCIGASFLCANIMRHSLLLWAILNCTLIYISTVSLGMHWLIAFSCVGPMLFVFWLFVRWSALNPTWTYVTCLMVLCMVHVPFVMLQQGQQGDPIPTLLLCALLVLLCNGLQQGGARWICLPVMALTVVGYVTWWIYRSDPFAMIEITYQNEWENFWALSTRIPVLLCILYGLMFSRRHVADGRSLWVALPLAQQVLMGTSLILVVAWCLSWRPSVWETAIIIGIMIWNARYMYAYLRHCDADLIRWPLLDALTLTLAAVIISTGECYMFYLTNQRETGTVSAGSLEIFVRAVKQDMWACLFTVILVFVVMRLDFMRRVAQRLVYISQFFKRRRTAAATVVTDAAGVKS